MEEEPDLPFGLLYPFLPFTLCHVKPLPSHHRNLNSAQEERECCKEFVHYVTFNKLSVYLTCNSLLLTMQFSVRLVTCREKNAPIGRFISMNKCKYDCDYFSAAFYVVTLTPCKFDINITGCFMVQPL